MAPETPVLVFLMMRIPESRAENPQVMASESAAAIGEETIQARAPQLKRIERRRTTKGGEGMANSNGKNGIRENLH